MKIDPDVLEKIATFLARNVQATEEGNRPSFVNFRDSDIDEIHLLGSRSGVLAISYIRFRLVGNIELNLAVSYYGTVVQRGVPVNEWISSL